jgi:hypothetical protein
MLNHNLRARRIADKQILAYDVNAWQDHRNKHHAKARLELNRSEQLSPFARVGKLFIGAQEGGFTGGRP